MADAGVQHGILRAVLGLPSPVLRALSGGGVVYRGGRTLDPRLQFLASLARRQPPLSSLTPPEARAASAQALSVLRGRAELGVRTETIVVENDSGAVDCRGYRPVVQDPLAPLMVFAHFGGGVIGDLETSHVFCTLLAHIARCPVLSVDYRLAPEDRFPAGLEDVRAAYDWAMLNGPRLGAPLGAAAIGGDSIGGTFAAAVCQELRREGEPQPFLQLLIYPALEVGSETPSMVSYADAYPLSRAALDWFAGHYIGPDADPADPRLSPLRAENLSGLAPAVVITAGFDPLVDQGEAYARRLRDAGVAVTYRCFDALAHGFTAFTGLVPAADAACRQVADLVRARIQGESEP